MARVCTARLTGLFTCGHCTVQIFPVDFEDVALVEFMYLAFTPMLGGELLEATRVFVVTFVFRLLSANCVLVLLILACF